LLNRVSHVRILAVACDHRVPIDGGKVRVRVDVLAERLPPPAWQHIGAGSNGARYYWAWLDMATADTGQSLLIRRNLSSLRSEHGGCHCMIWSRACWSPLTKRPWLFRFRFR
jgi:hypothetical protein